jgi:hypothetical protein
VTHSSAPTSSQPQLTDVSLEQVHLSAVISPRSKMPQSSH